MRDMKEKLSHTIVDLHWLVGLTLISLLTVGTNRGEFEAYALYPIHKSTGMRSSVIILGRAVWRLMNGLPATAADHENESIILLSSCIDTADWHPHLSNLRYDHVRAWRAGLGDAQARSVSPQL